MNKKIEQAFNEQMNKEYYSAYLYLAMAGYFETIGLKGFASWMKKHFQEEQSHAEKFFNFICEKKGTPLFPAITGINDKWTSPLNVFKYALAHEKKVTSYINDLMQLAVKEKDLASQNLLQWFMSEQEEEEATFGDILQKLESIGNDQNALELLDKKIK
jgi:ferritin